MKRCLIGLLLISLTLIGLYTADAGLASRTIREAAEDIIKMFGKGAAGQTVEEVAEATAKAVAKYGDNALPLLRKTGHAGFTALDDAGEKAADLIQLYIRKGDDAIWLISDPKKVDLFLKQGDSAADAILKHPGIAEDLIPKFGDDAIGALNRISRENAQRLTMLAKDGVLNANKQSPALLPIIRKHGDEAMDFIWKNKGALTVATALGMFIAEPEVYISGTKDLIVEPVVSEMVKSIGWTKILVVVLVIAFLPCIVRSIKQAQSIWKNQEEKARPTKSQASNKATSSAEK